jgi:hypothetical protein
MRKPLAVVGLTAALALAGATAAVAAPPAPNDANAGGRAMVCHVTGSETNPVVEIYVPRNANAPQQSCDAQQPEDWGL